MNNVLLTDLGLSTPLMFLFENFIDKCVSASLDSATVFIDSKLLKCSIFLFYLSYFRCQIQGMKSFGNMKQAACLVCGKP